MCNENTVFEWHVSQHSSTLYLKRKRRIPREPLWLTAQPQPMTDLSSSITSLSQPMTRRRSEDSPVWACSVGSVCEADWCVSYLLKPVTKQHTPVVTALLIPWFRAQSWTDSWGFSGCPEENRLFGCSCHSYTSLVLRVGNMFHFWKKYPGVYPSLR